MLIGGTYDWNGRGINDIEPSPTVTSLSPHYDSIDLRDYMYYRTRWGTSGSADYRLSNGSSLALRGLYSTFRNWGQKWVYTLNDGDVPSASMDWRRPDYAVGNLVGSGRHTIGQNWLTWDVSGARSRMLQSGGNGGANFKWNGGDTNCVYDPGRDHRRQPADVQRVVLHAGTDQHRGHRQLQALVVESRVGRRVGAGEPAGRGERRASRITSAIGSGRSSSAARSGTRTSTTTPTRPPTPPPKA